MWNHTGERPSAWVERFADLVPPGAAVLDVACGGGRHARLFRARGHPVVAVDRDLVGVADLAADPGVTLVAADLEDGSAPPFAGQTFGGVVVTRYLHRPLLPHLVAAVAPGGVLLYETFAVGQERVGRPRNPDFLLRRGELLEAVRGRLDVVAFEDVVDAGQRLQRLCARSPGRDEGPGP